MSDTGGDGVTSSGGNRVSGYGLAQSAPEDRTPDQDPARAAQRHTRDMLAGQEHEKRPRRHQSKPDRQIRLEGDLWWQEHTHDRRRRYLRSAATRCAA